eukprot:6039697-Pleurochrysis_carterae.AAC.1
MCQNTDARVSPFGGPWYCLQFKTQFACLNGGLRLSDLSSSADATFLSLSWPRIRPWRMPGLVGDRT